MSKTAINEPEPVTNVGGSLRAAQAAHDLGNFLTGIRMLSQLAIQDADDSCALQQHLLSLEQAALHAGHLCNHLQRSLAGDADGAPMTHQRIELNALVESIRGLLSVLIRPEATLGVDLSNESPACSANPTQMRQIIVDLVTNSSDSLGSDGGSITLRTGQMNSDAQSMQGVTKYFGVCDRQDGVFLEVSDSGNGIPESKLEKIFCPRYTTKKERAGHGLGLSNVLAIVQSLGGGVTVSSRLGTGTTIRCVLPTAAEQRPSLENSEPSDTRLQASQGSLNILLVDDNRAMQFLVKSMLEGCERLDATVQTAISGREATEFIGQNGDALSVIILDMNLPDIDGAQLIGKLRDAANGVPVILASASPKCELETRCSACPPDSILVKPFDIHTLVDEIIAVCTRGHR